MTFDELFSKKYIFCKYENREMVYWLPSASGYTDELANAGIFTKEDCERFGLEVLNCNDFKKERHVKLIHYAISVSTMMVLSWPQ